MSGMRTADFEYDLPEGAIAQLERDLTADRVRSGMRRAKGLGRHVGRPRVKVDMDRLRKLHREGRSLREIACELQISKSKAGELVNVVAQQVGGKGGGRPDMAQAGGNQPQALAAALASVPDWVREKLGA